ncbi:hypothetical protein M2138_001241 [Dysgonomonadaceae bacterium PH5-43]|nr:hypothetical protein [Dysgonomonadaceae bacterium PH5-43]
MNNPLDSERIANENAAEDMRVNNVSEENTSVNLETNEEVQVVEEKKSIDCSCLTKEEIVDRLSVVVEEGVTEKTKSEVESLKQAFYKLRKIEIEEEKKEFLKADNQEEDFVPTEDLAETKLKEQLTIFREKKATIIAEEEKIKEDNLNAKKEIIDNIKELIESKDDFYKVYNEFKKLQQQWKEIKQVPASAVNDLWKEYQYYSEKFYDLVKINNEMRDYDFKKNLELKQNLCEVVEKLDQEKDVVSAFYQLQKFHQEWREIGPVAREIREEIWSRFKKASSVINKKHQDHFETLRNSEQKNLEEKTAICEEIEAIDFSKLNSYKEWDEQNKNVIKLQEKWKTIGFAPKKHNVKIFERFRAACDNFFQKKGEFYKNIKDNMETNLTEKTALCEEAEALKDSQDWKSTTEKMVALQKKWKTSGPVPRKYSDNLWKRFIAACDYFFEQKNIHFSSQKTEETDNLNKKKEIIANIKAIDESIPSNEAVKTLRAYISEFNSVGFVPFKDKDKIYKEFRTEVDAQFDRLKIDESERRLQSFRTNVKDMISGDKPKNKLFNERDKLMRTYERIKNDLQSYENNIGFLSISSKGGGGLVKELEKKIESLKSELILIEKKIDTIDQALDAQD